MEEKKEMKNPIVELIEERGLSPSDLVSFLDRKVSRSSIYGWIDGSHVPSRGNVHIFLDLFDLDQEEKMRWKFKIKRWRKESRENE